MQSLAMSDGVLDTCTLENFEELVMTAEPVWSEIPFSLKIQLNAASHSRMLWLASEEQDHDKASAAFENLAIGLFPNVLAESWNGKDFQNGAVLNEIDARVKDGSCFQCS